MRYRWFDRMWIEGCVRLEFGVLRFWIVPGIVLGCTVFALFFPWANPGAKAEAIAVAMACDSVEEIQAGTHPIKVVAMVYQGTATKGFREANGHSLRLILKPVDDANEKQRIAATAHLAYRVNQSLADRLIGHEPGLQVAIATIDETEAHLCRQRGSNAYRAIHG